MEKARTIEDTEYSLKKGLDIQREMYKQARHLKNLSVMCSCIENIKGEIKGKAMQKAVQNKDDIEFIEKVIDWYRSIKQRYTKKSPHGHIVKLPININDVAMRNLHLAYERLVNILENLELI